MHDPEEDQDKVNFDEEANKQDKLEDIQKKYRNAESDRRAYAEETAALVKKQRATIEKIKKENMALKEYIAQLNNQAMKTTQTVAARTTNLEAIADEYRQKIQEEREKMKDIEDNIKLFQEKIVGQKSSLGGMGTGAESQAGLTKQIKILENRLDKANQKFNEAIALNKKLRAEIDSLRRERVIFDNLYKKLERELHEKRKQMANIIESANSAYEERDKANDQIQNLKQQAKREASDFEKDLKGLSQAMEQIRKGQEYMNMASHAKEEGGGQREERPDTEKSKLRDTSRRQDRGLDPASKEKMIKYQEDFAKIQAATGIKNIEDLVTQFIQNEETNFTKFKYVNELSNEIELLQKTIDELKEEKAKYEGQGTTTDVSRKMTAKNLSERLDLNRAKAEQFDYKYHEATKKVNSLCNWIETLFNTIECDKNLAKELTGSHGVTESNMMTYLGIIEDRATEILYYYAILAKPKTYDINDANLLLPMQKAGKGDMGTLEEEQSDEEVEGDKAFNEEELIQKALSKLEEKKNSQSGARTKKPTIKTRKNK